MMRNVGMSMGEKYLEGSLMKDLSPMLETIWNYRNLIFIVLIWIVIGLQSYYEYLSVWEHYNYATGNEMHGSQESERIQRDSIVEPGKISIGLSGTIWGLFFTGYFLNSHAKVMKKD